jgi:hypothetical protein
MEQFELCSHGVVIGRAGLDFAPAAKLAVGFLDAEPGYDTVRSLVQRMITLAQAVARADREPTPEEQALWAALQADYMALGLELVDEDGDVLPAAGIQIIDDRKREAEAPALLTVSLPEQAFWDARAAAGIVDPWK